jgi:hypothetical protein
MLAMSSMLMYKQWVLNRNAHKTRLCIDPLRKIFWLKEHNPVFSPGKMIPCSQIQCSDSVYRIMTVMNIDFFSLQFSIFKNCKSEIT